MNNKIKKKKEKISEVQKKKMPGLYPNTFSKSNCKLLFTPYCQLFLYPPMH
jgi:hypothetical protein